MVNLIQTTSAGLKKEDKKPIPSGFLNNVFITIIAKQQKQQHLNCAI